MSFSLVKFLQTLRVSLPEILTMAIPDGPLTTFPQCMPDECKSSDPVVGYMTYYNYKADDWDARGIPMKWYGQEAV